MLRDRRSRRRCRRRRRTLLSDVGCVRNPSGLNDVVVVKTTLVCIFRRIIFLRAFATAQLSLYMYIDPT